MASQISPFMTTSVFLQAAFFNNSEKMNAKAMTSSVQNLAGLAKLTQHALEAFYDLQTTSEYFDPLVGDCSCDIRAVLLVHYAKDHQVLLDIQQTLVNLEGVPELLEAQAQNAKVRKQKATLNELVEEISGLAARLEITNHTHLLICSFILGKGKIPAVDYGAQDKAEPRLLMRYGLTKNAATTLIKVARRSVATHSVSYIRSLAEKLSCPKELQEHLSEVYLKVDPRAVRGVGALPCFPVAEVVYQEAIKEKIPLVLQIARHSASCQGGDEDKVLQCFLKVVDGKYLLTDLDGTEDPSTPVWVWTAYTCKPAECSDKEVLESVANDVEDFFMCDSAVHPTYPREWDCGDGPISERKQHYYDLAFSKGYWRTEESMDFNYAMVHFSFARLGWLRGKP